MVGSVQETEQNCLPSSHPLAQQTPCYMAVSVTQWSGRSSVLYGVREQQGAAPPHTTTTVADGPRSCCGLLIKSYLPSATIYALTMWRVRSLPHPSKTLGSLGKEDGRRKLFFLTGDHFEALSVCNSLLLSQGGDLIEELQGRNLRNFAI